VEEALEQVGDERVGDGRRTLAQAFGAGEADDAPGERQRRADDPEPGEEGDDGFGRPRRCGA
jgi:hypothetical protein